MEPVRKLTTKEKALQVNLKRDIYGSFAEIGAGQEVAANFFKAGGASGTIAKTMSAYDMKFSDEIYGKTDRYVCESRLELMLDKEYRLLKERLPEMANDTKFFAFANTVEALNYTKTNQPHGWMGLRFQTKPGAPANHCVVHVRMRDNDSLLQQDALGIIGVNLVYGCFFMDDPEELLYSLLDDLVPGRIEVDMFRLDGPDFEDVDNRLLSLKLVKSGMTRAAMFGSDGKVLQPSEALYKKNVLVLRGRFRPVTHVNVDMLLKARKIFKTENDVDKKKILVLTELTLTDLSNEGEIDEQDFLNRVDIICSLGQTVMISNYQEYYLLVQYMSRMNRGRKIGIILGIYNLQRVFDESYYQNLRGGILEAFGSLFGHNVKLYVYPSLRQDGEGLHTLESINLPDKLNHLFQYLVENNKLEMVEGANTQILHIISDHVLARIQAGDSGWESCVPRKVAETIKKKKYFDYPGERSKITKSTSS